MPVTCNTCIHAYLNTCAVSLNTANETAMAFYNVVSTSDGNDTVGLSLRYVPSIGYPRPHPFGYCDLHGAVWAIHHVPGYFFWPPIPKRVCDRPCRTFGRRCRPALRKILCIRRYVWWCDGYQCIPYGVQSVYYEYHFYCKSSCGFNFPYCYL